MMKGQVTTDDARNDETVWSHRLAMVTAGTTFFLILIGGIVTSTDSGLAVPDWPTTFGYNMFTYPLSQMAGGVLYEHSHRLIGSLVGALTVTLAAVLWALDRRSWVRWLGVAALAAVIVQGILGGLRVVLVAEKFAIVHGAFAQAFFALAASLVLFTSPGWNRPIEAIATREMFRLRRLSLVTTVGLYLQVVLGALVTHLGRGADAHIGVAVLASAAVVLLGVRVASGRTVWPELVLPMETLRGLWILQLILGVGSYVARFHAALMPMSPALALAFPLAHRLAGALMLVTSLVLTLRACRRSGWVDVVPGSEAASRRVPA